MSAPDSPQQQPIALIGIGCRLPGGINSPQQFWDTLIRGEDMITEVPPDRWDVEKYYDPEIGVPGKSVSRWGGFLPNIEGFDAAFFSLSEREAAAMDPQQRLLLETAWEAVEHAGVQPSSLAGTQGGVFLGLSHDDYVVAINNAGALGDPYAFGGTMPSMASGRIAYALDLRGAALTSDTACSSSLTSVHQACRSLQDYSCDSALAGGCVVILFPEKVVSMNPHRMTSPTGRCRSFSNEADGFVRSEGCAVVMLKRLDDAERDGNRILAVIRGIAANQDGRSSTQTAPSLEQQTSVYRAALESADVDPNTVGMVEAHGTGTPVGDPIEFRSLAQLYGRDGVRCAVGSAKTNIGHTESAAGVVGLIKTSLALEHGVIPPSLHFTGLREDLHGLETGLFVPTEPTPWPNSHGPRRAAVSSYGISGTNVHAVLEQAPATTTTTNTTAARDGEAMLFPLSSTSPESLRTTAQNIADWVAAHRDDITTNDVAYTLSQCRDHRPVRATVMARNIDELSQGLAEIAQDDSLIISATRVDDRGPVWVFSGQGSQWASMGTHLLDTEPVFAEWVAKLEPLVRDESGFSITEAMTSPATVTGFDRVQPTLFAMQVAMAATLRSYGVNPGAVIGHSMGEAAASVVAGMLTPEDGVKVICRRSQLCLKIAGKGAMASVELPADRVREELASVDGAVVAVMASPHSTVIGGETNTVRALVHEWEERGIWAREVAVDVASHSPQVDPILGELAEALADLTPGSAPIVPFYTATLDDPQLVPPCGPSYWVDNLRNPVRFAAAVEAAMHDGFRVFTEISPHPLLLRAIDQVADSSSVKAHTIAAMRSEAPMPHGLLKCVSDVHTSGAAVDFSALVPHGRLLDVPLPSWTYKHLTVRTDPTEPTSRVAGVHPMLGEHARLPEPEERHVWNGDVGTRSIPWAADHVSNGVPSLPGAGFCEMAMSASRSVFTQDVELRDVRFENFLLLDESTPVTTTVTMETPHRARFEAHTSDDDGEHVRQSSAVIHAVDGPDQQPEPLNIRGLLEQHPRENEGTVFRQAAASKRNFKLGPKMAGLVAVRFPETHDQRTALSEVKLPTPVRSDSTEYAMHPVLLDSSFQSIAAFSLLNLDEDDEGRLMVLRGVRKLRLYGPMRNARYCYTRMTREEANELEADMDVVDETGTVLLSARGLQAGIRGSADEDRVRLFTSRLVGVGWESTPPPGITNTPSPSAVLVVNSPAGMTDELHALGARCTAMTWPRTAYHSEHAKNLSDLLASGGFGRVVMFGDPPTTTDVRTSHAQHESLRVVHAAQALAGMDGRAPRLYVVTRNAQHVVSGDAINLDHAGVRGILRVIGSENPHLHPTHIDTDDNVSWSGVAREVLSGSEEDETAWRGDQWHVARLRSTPLTGGDRHSTHADHDQHRVVAHVRDPGNIDTLELVTAPRLNVGPRQIEVAVSASSVNFVDVLTAYNRYKFLADQMPGLGRDFAGTVVAVGDEVSRFRVGDVVAGSTRKDNSWATFVTCDERVAAPVPEGMSLHTAASVPCAYVTAWYGLHDVARIKPGDRVLIHSATGGVGQAAMAIAREAGAEIFATAGSPERRDLLRNMGVRNVYDSRSTEFKDMIHNDTGGYGVDIVLNSLAGPAQRAGIETLADLGRFVEIGKRDVYGGTRLDLYPFRNSLSFAYVDLFAMIETHPDIIGRATESVLNKIHRGELDAPITTTYPLHDAATAVRTMGSANHTGKQVLTIDRPGHSTASVPPGQYPAFRTCGSYIITGGLSGLGLFLAGHLARNGCGRIVLSSRSEPQPPARHAIEHIQQETGADIHVICGDIAEPGTASMLVTEATRTGLPLRGVLHSAAVVNDATLPNIDEDLFERNWKPKVLGAWQLHHATADIPLDWFCMFSSAAALLGSPGQGAYSASNSWLDAFTWWRRANNLPATTIAWGAWAEIGLGTAFENYDDATIAPEEGAYAFERMLRHNRPWTGYCAKGIVRSMSPIVERRPFGAGFSDSDTDGNSSDDVRSELLALPPGEWAERLRRFVGEQVQGIVRNNVDMDRSFNQHGLDSLGMLELRTRIETGLRIRVSTKVIQENDTVRALAHHLEVLLAPAEQ